MTIEDNDGHRVNVTVSNQSGTLYGNVLNDAGFGLPDARVTVWGAETGATTNATGWFQLTGVPPGKRQVRAEHAGYRPAESDIEIPAGQAMRLTFTLVPATEDDAGYRPHAHDYWGGRTEVVATDTDWTFWRWPASGPYGTVQNQAYYPAYAFASGPCVTSDLKRVLPNSSPFWFDDPAQTVWPGTSEIRVKLSWSTTDYPVGDRLALAWKPTNQATFNWSSALRNGDTLRIPVNQTMWDSGHQPFTLWEFYACLWGRDEPRTAASTYTGRLFTGKFHATVTLERGLPILADPVHPRFWQNGSTLPVVDATRTFSCTDSSTSSACVNAALGARGVSWDTFTWRPKAGTTVPPGTANLSAVLSWTSSPATQTKVLSLTFSPSSLPPPTKNDPATYTTSSPVAKGTSSRTYDIQLKPGDADGFYQRISNWAFMWNVEGEEGSPSYVHSCACTLTIRLVVTAHEDPAYG